MNKIALAGTGIITLELAPVAHAGPPPQYVKTPWGTRCQVGTQAVTCDTCEPGLLLDTPRLKRTAGRRAAAKSPSMAAAFEGFPWAAKSLHRRLTFSSSRRVRPTTSTAGPSRWRARRAGSAYQRREWSQHGCRCAELRHLLKKNHMRIIALAAGLSCAAVVFAPHAAADFDNGGRFNVQVPHLLCQIGPDGAVCQGLFPQAPVEPCSTPICPNPPMHSDQAVVTADGKFQYRDANIGVGDHPTLNTLAPGQTASVRGWQLSSTQAGVSLTSPTGHGMSIDANGNVNPF